MSGSKTYGCVVECNEVALALYFSVYFFMLCDVNVPQASQLTTYICVNLTGGKLTYKIN